jgi:hypothetical protein
MLSASLSGLATLVCSDRFLAICFCHLSGRVLNYRVQGPRRLHGGGLTSSPISAIQRKRT